MVKTGYIPLGTDLYPRFELNVLEISVRKSFVVVKNDCIPSKLTDVFEQKVPEIRVGNAVR